MIKINLSVLGKFHTFDLAREMAKREALGTIYSAYPKLKLRDEGISLKKIKSFPYIHAPYMAYPFRESLNSSILWGWEYLDRISFDFYTSKSIDDCDVFVGLSSSALLTGSLVKKRGGKYVCDRGSSHIRFQNDILQEENDIWGGGFLGIDPRVIAREEAEYAEADVITVPSSFNFQSFIDCGIDSKKIHVIPYGVNLSRFFNDGIPKEDEFNVLFVGAMSLRKGVQYLLQAYHKVVHPKKSLTLVGPVSPSLIELLKRHRLWTNDIRVLGHLPQSSLKSIMSRSHAMVLPSVEEGLAMVQAQAMACGCVVIASTNTGASNIINDNHDGYIVPIRSSDSIANKLQMLADDFELRMKIGKNAINSVSQRGGWNDYGDATLACYTGLI